MKLIKIATEINYYDIKDFMDLIIQMGVTCEEKYVNSIILETPYYYNNKLKKYKIKRSKILLFINEEPFKYKYSKDSYIISHFLNKIINTIKETLN